MKKIKISASTNPPPANEFHRYLRDLDDLDIDYIHCDVMDGKFVQSLSLSFSTVKMISKVATKPLDVHLMVKSPSKLHLARYIRLKPEFLTVHYETYMDKEKLKNILLYINKKGIKAGLAINPDTDVEQFKDLVPYCAMFLIMTVVPGKSGQKMIDSCLDKIKQIKKIAKEYQIDDITFEVDGGVNLDTIAKVIKAGADMAVSGKALYVAENRYDFVKKFTSGNPNTQQKVTK
jgi:ribulose-phosphate 3-epimerase